MTTDRTDYQPTTLKCPPTEEGIRSMMRATRLTWLAEETGLPRSRLAEIVRIDKPARIKFDDGMAILHALEYFQ